MMYRNPSVIAVAIGLLLATIALLPAAVNVKTVGGVSRANVKTVGGVALANVKSIGGVDNTSGGGATYLINQNFEGAGYDNSETWTEASGTPNEDYTSTVLAGSQSLLLDSTGAVNQRVDSPAFAAMTDGWAYMLFHPVTLPAAGNNSFFQLRSSTTLLGQVQINSSGALRVNSGAVSSSYTTSTMSAANTYHIWVHYIDGTGANGFLSVGFSTDGTKPTAGNAYQELTTGTHTADCDNIRVLSDATMARQIILDRILVDDASIGNSP